MLLKGHYEVFIFKDKYFLQREKHFFCGEITLISNVGTYYPLKLTPISNVGTNVSIASIATYNEKKIIDS
jgi:hypothetical protein